MKNLVRETPYVRLFHESDTELVTAQWLPETKYMSPDGLREQFSILGEIVKTYQPKSWLADLRNFLFTITPELQEWTDQKIAGVFQEYGVQKMVMLFPEEISFEKLAVEQLTEEETFITAWETRFFANEDKAREWLQEPVLVA